MTSPHYEGDAENLVVDSPTYRMILEVSWLHICDCDIQIHIIYICNIFIYLETVDYSHGIVQH